MKLAWLRLSNFQSCGPTPLRVDFDAMTYVLGPNGAGKTALLQALARLFGVDSSLRRIRRSDFHVPTGETDEAGKERGLWIEVQFEFPELLDPHGKYATVPGHFAHLQLDSADGVPRVRMRLTATLDADGDIEESFTYVIQNDANGDPIRTVGVQKAGRSQIQVHYLPARRDPADQIAYTANSLLGRLLRAANWEDQRDAIAGLAEQMSDELAGNEAVAQLSAAVKANWGLLHKGAYYKDPQVSFAGSEIEALLKQLSLSFGPGPEQPLIDFKRLSDGQQSLLYLSLVLSLHALGRDALAGTSKAFDLEKLRPPVFTLIAMEEPENSLSPHYLGRVVKALQAFASGHDGQAVVATHAPSMLKRVPPEAIRYLRLNAHRQTTASHITLPPTADEAFKYVREAVQAYPELYFSRLVILGEGASEEIVVPRALAAKGLAADDIAVAIAPLGGRHVHHFWRLLTALGIPHLTLLDLDRGRFQGGWGRVRYACKQAIAIGTAQDVPGKLKVLPEWNGDDDVMVSAAGIGWRTWLANTHGVFFSSPLDLDFAMISAYPDAYGIAASELQVPDAETISSVLGKSAVHVDHYGDTARFFGAYRARFKEGSKPVEHLAALAKLTDKQLLDKLPTHLKDVVAAAEARLKAIPE